MSIRCTFRETRYEPAEFEYTNPETCIVCGSEHDLDDGTDHIVLEDDSIVCRGKCHTSYKIQTAQAAFFTFLNTAKVADRIRAIMASPSVDTLKTLHDEVEHASYTEEDGYLDTDEVSGILSDLEDAQYDLEQGNNEAFQTAMAKVLAAIPTPAPEAK